MKVVAPFSVIQKAVPVLCQFFEQAAAFGAVLHAKARPSHFSFHLLSRVKLLIVGANQ